MSFDTSRFTFDPWKNYSGVVMEQGRVQLDSDWNEWLAQLSRRIQAGTLDIMGRAAYPATTPHAFEMAFDSSGKLTIGPGRMYVDGLLAENHGDPAAPVWDPALAELSGSPQPPPSTEIGAIEFTSQPWFPTAAPPADLSVLQLAYLDVWQRAVTYLEDPHLIDPAVGIDTTGRLQTIWQVKLAPVSTGATCTSAGNPWPPDSSGLLTTKPINSTPSGPCCLTTNTGYTGMENQNYRVEIHTPGPVGTATFKWSRDNASVETGVTGIVKGTNSVGVTASQLTLLSMGRDQMLGFTKGNWIEILDDDLELAGLAGELHLIDTVDFAAKIITLDGLVSTTSFPVDGSNQTTPSRHTRIRRWDQSGKIYESDNTTVYTTLGAKGDILVPPAATSLILENGITVNFGLSSATGSFNTGDFWTFAARAADGTLEELTSAPPRGIHHHYTPLSVVDFAAQTASDCRTKWAPGGEECCGCCSVTVGDGKESHGQYTSINAAIKALLPSGGEVCILPGRYFEYVFLEGLHDVVVRGCGYHTRIASPALAPNASPAATAANNTFRAVISIADSQHIQLRDFAVEADTGDVGILIDGTGDLIATPPPDNSGGPAPAPAASAPAASAPAAPADTSRIREFATSGVSFGNLSRTIDITVEDTFITASTMPAILAKRIHLLRIDDNRIAMKNVATLWPAVYVSGNEIHVDRNYVGIQSVTTLSEWLPVAVVGDLSASAVQVKAAVDTTVVQPPPVVKLDSTAKINKAIKAKPAASALSAARQISAADFNLIDVSSYIAIPQVAIHFGGIQVAGPSRDVFLIENQIEGGRFNGITLGSYDILNANGTDTGQTTGITTIHEDPCSTTGTLQPPGPGSGSNGNTVVAGGRLVNIHIDRNRISDMGLCGIGPVGFFDLSQILEVISIEDLFITENTILNTLLRPTAPIQIFGVASGTVAGNPSGATGTSGSSATFGPVRPISAASMPYGAICVPSVENLVIRDNAITNFGEKPGAQADGIFVLNGEMVEISRNQILETRDWHATAEVAGVTSGLHGGIIIAIVTPPALSSSATGNLFAKAVYEPGLPALRVQENVVRVPLGQAFVAIGFGPFAISDNHFTCGGAVRGRGVELAQTVLIMNLGTAIEAVALSSPSKIYNGSMQDYAGLGRTSGDSPFAASSNGTVLFTDNICQLEARADRQRSITSLTIISTDHLIFANNQCWIDTATFDAIVDAMLIAGTLNVTGNRFQESPISVFLSGLTAGVVNITSQNISTFCLLVEGAMKIHQPNLALIEFFSPNLCGGNPNQ